MVFAAYAVGASSQSAVSVATRSASKPVRSTNASSSGSTARAWETPTRSVASVAYMRISGTRVPEPR